MIQKKSFLMRVCNLSALGKQCCGNTEFLRINASAWLKLYEFHVGKRGSCTIGYTVAISRHTRRVCTVICNMYTARCDYCCLCLHKKNPLLIQIIYTCSAYRTVISIYIGKHGVLHYSDTKRLCLLF